MAICVRFEAPLPMLWVAAALGVLELSLGDAAAAWTALAPYAEALEARGGGEAFAILLVPADRGADRARRPRRGAERRLERLERNAQENDRLWALAESARCRALLLARAATCPPRTRRSSPRSPPHRVDVPFERARALLAQGQIARRRKQKRAARESLDAALALFE